MAFVFGLKASLFEVFRSVLCYTAIVMFFIEMRKIEERTSEQCSN